MYEKKTIEEKAKAYDEATKTIKASLDALNDITEMGEKVVNIQPIKNCFYRAFPELKNKEDEDEKIRKEILSYIKSSGAVTNKQWIAWLEKQGNQNLPSVNERAWLYLVDDVLTWNDGIGQYLDDPRVQKLAKDLCSEYAQKLYNFPISSNSSNVENNKQEPADKDKPKFKIEEGKWYVCTQTYTLQGKIVAIKGQAYKSYQDGAIEGEDERLFIDKIDGKVLDYFKPWTINDAKDGDILAENSCLFIIKKLNHDHSAEIYCCLHNDGDFNVISTLVFNDTSTYPATKEQRDTLTKAMADAGYIFDFESKELKELAHQEMAETSDQETSEWNEEDEKEFEKIIDHFDWGSNNGFSHSDCNRAQDWLKSLKGRIQPQPKQEWSKEDEGLFDLLHTCVCLSINNPYWEYSKREKVSKEIIPFIDRLKSLRPLNTWKPSDEQLDALRYIWQHYTPAVTERKAWESLKNIEILYGQLKKQKED